ncbi:Hypothetical protein NTJ_13727 [Nesidiocoris tenuis]|uniref:Uncharacterized protein n=1 Tax=Nesidiocoris tenuis TaxID=355587 RepID=A0ABN7B943_9HEMI|nr:Hypothetical protein NTJ_13727 [Nesidiocoris tenuis]
MLSRMSFPNRPQISRVRSSHSLRSQPVKITRCPDVPGPSILSEVNLSGERPVDPRPRRAVRRNAMKPSSSKARMAGSVRLPVTAAIPDEPALLTDDFLEEMKAGLDEMGEKLKHVERELTKKKGPVTSQLSVKSLKKPSPQSKKEKSEPRPSLAGYNPIDFTDLDFGMAAFASSDDSRHSNIAADAAPGAVQATPDEAVEDVIAKIRNDIRKWRIAKGIPEPPADIACVEKYPPATSNGGDIVVREAAERETPCQSNSLKKRPVFTALLLRNPGELDQKCFEGSPDTDRATMPLLKY